MFFLAIFDHFPPSKYTKLPEGFYIKRVNKGILVDYKWINRTPLVASVKG